METFVARYPQMTPGQLIEQAIARDQAEVVLGLLRDTNIEINLPCDPQRYDSVSPLMTALRAGSARLVALIAAQPAFDLARSLPSYERWSWARTSSLEVLQQYLSIPGSDVNQTDGNGKTLMHEVVYDPGTQDKLLTLLSQPGIVIDAKQADGTTPLYRAGLADNASAFALLLGRGADPNNRNNDNLWTILMCAVAYNHGAIVEQLLQRPEIDVNAVSDIGNTALHIAVERDHLRMVQLLLQDPEVNINLKNHMGWTALTKAAFASQVEMVRQLLQRPDLEVNFVDQDRQTPLLHAAANGHREVVRLLLADARTNTAITNRPARQTARDIAAALGFESIAELINSHTGDRDELSPRDSYLTRSRSTEFEERAERFERSRRKKDT